MRRLTVIFAILSLAMLLGGAMCSTQPARMKPKKFDLRFKVAPPLIGAAVEVDIIELTAARLEMERFWEVETFEPGRVSSVSGANRFVLRRR